MDQLALGNSADMSVADQMTSVDFAFKPPETTGAIPLAYNANGSYVEIVGTNFGELRAQHQC